MLLLPLLSRQKNIRLAFSTVRDGNMSFRWGAKSEVAGNREKFLEKLGLIPEDCVGMSLTHGLTIKSVDAAAKGVGLRQPNGMAADCLVTKEKGLVLFLLTADCLPVILYDPARAVLALAHISRKNIGQQFVEKIINKLSARFGCQPKNVVVGIGPGIHQKSYKHTDAPEKQQLDWQPYLKEVADGQTAIDLVGYTAAQLLAAGILQNNMEISEIDTAASKEFFSHCRAKRTGEPEGRFATVAGMVQKL
jgi:copper oxidase (laccase) domain-containing protein